MVHVPRDTSSRATKSAADILFGFVAGLAFVALCLNLTQEQRVGSLARRSLLMQNDLSTTTSKEGLSLAMPTALSVVKEEKRDFLEIGQRTGTDKVLGHRSFAKCLANPSVCAHPNMENAKCRTAPGHFYHTLYNKWLGRYSTNDAEPFQFLEVGYYNGKGFDAYKEFLPRAEAHSMEIACIEPGLRAEGKWPWGNFAAKNPRYEEFRNAKRLHCGDASDFSFLHEIWTTEMKRFDAPPLKVVVDDASHLAEHMATTLFFWFPRIEPGGVLIIEDIQPIQEANKFRTNVLPQVMKDLHYCGDPKFRDEACFPTIWPLLQSIHCEMHICVFERNDQPAVEYGKDLSMPPKNALDAEQCLLRAH